MRIKLPAMLFTTFLWAGLVGVSPAQNTNSGDISGIVTDTTGAAVPGVSVTVLNIATGVSKDFVTNESGASRHGSIVAGTYKLTFVKSGFSTLVRSSITVIVGPTNVPAQLSVGGVNQEVVVGTDIPLLKTENGEQSVTLSAENLAALPEVGQDWTQFSILLPGSAGAPGGSQGSLAAAGSTAPGVTVAINAATFPSARYWQTGQRQPSPAQTQTFLTGDDPGTSVQHLGVYLCAVRRRRHHVQPDRSKGGTNKFHGSVYEYFQNEALNALPYAFSGPTHKYFRYNNFGGSIGGPILRDNLFFYFNVDKIISRKHHRGVFYCSNSGSHRW